MTRTIEGELAKQPEGYIVPALHIWAYVVAALTLPILTAAGGCFVGALLVLAFR